MKLYFRAQALSLALVSVGAALAATQAYAWYGAPNQWRPANPVNNQTVAYNRAANLPAFRPARAVTSRDRFARAQPRRIASLDRRARQVERRYRLHRPMPPVRQAMLPAPIAPFSSPGGMPFMQPPMMTQMWPPMPMQPVPQWAPAEPPVSATVGHADRQVPVTHRVAPVSRFDRWPVSPMHSRWRPVEPASTEMPRYGQRTPIEGAWKRNRQAALGRSMHGRAAQFVATAPGHLVRPTARPQWRPAGHMPPRFSYQPDSSFRPLHYGRPAAQSQSGLASVRASAHTRNLPGWVTTYHDVDRVDCDHCRGG